MVKRCGKTIGAGLLALTMALSVTACGDGGKPSKEEVREAFVAEMDGQELNETTEPLVDCMVDGLYEDLSPEALRAIADRDEDFDPRASSLVAVDAVGQRCVTESVG